MLKFFPASGSIRRRTFFLLGGMSLGALLIANFFWLPSAIEDIRQTQLELRRVSVRLVGDQIQQYLEAKEADLTRTAQRFRPYLREGDREGLRITVQGLLQRDPAFEEIGILDENGKEIIRISRRLAITDQDLVDRSASSFFREGMRQEVYWAPVTITETSEPWVTLALRRPGSGGISGGLVFAIINLKSLWNLTREFKLSREGQVYIVEEQGRLIAAADPSRVLRRLSFADRPFIHQLTHLQNPDGHSFVEGIYTNERGVNVVATGLLLTSPRWGVVIEQPQSVLFAPIRQKIWLFVSLSIMGLLLSFGLAHALSGRLTGPIIRLREGAEQIGGGNLEYEVPVETGDEIGELARQFNLMAEQLRISQQATLSALTIPVINQTSELQEVLGEVIAKVMNVTGAEAASIRLVDDGGKQFGLSVYRGFSEAYVRERSATVREELGEGMILKTAWPFIAGDLLDDPARNRHPLARDGFRSAVCFALKTPSKTFGIMTLASREAGRLGPKQANLFVAIAHEITVALQNARLFQETERNLERMRTLHEIDRAITSTLDLRAVLDVLLEKIDLVLPYAATTIRLFNKKNGLLEPMVCRNLDEKEWMAEQWRGGRGLANIVYETRAPTIIANAQTDPRVRDPEFYHKHRLVSYLGVPLLVKGEALGALGFYTKEEHEFSPEEVEFLSTLASQAAIAIYNSQLYERSNNLAIELEKSNKVKDEFLGVMSHELRTPLSVIVGYTGMIKDKIFGEITPEQNKALEKIMARSNDLLSMISGILQATSIESKSVAVESHEINLSSFLNELRSAYDCPLGKELILNWDYPSALSTMKTDGQKLKHILQNLINNAIKFTAKGSVTISAGVKEGSRQTAAKKKEEPCLQTALPTGDKRWVEFKVADTGIGIPKEKHSLIFEMFRQVDSSETRLYGGVGLGLYIVKKYTEMLGGTVEVESKVGKGSIFTVTIPCDGLRSEINRSQPW